MDVVNPIIEEAISRSFHIDQQTESLLKSCLRILPFVDPPSIGFDRIKEIVANTQFPRYWLRDILPALGNSRCNDALDILLEVASSDGKQFQNLALEWVDAVAALGTPESKRILLSFIDPDIQYLHLEQHNLDYHVRRTLTSHIVNFARMDSSIMTRLFLLCGRQHSPSSRLLLAEVIAGLGTAEALMAGLDDFIRKPYRPSEIFACMGRHLGVRYRRVQADPTPPAETLRPEALASLPDVLRAELRDALMALDRDLIQRVIGQVAKQDAALGAALAQRADHLAYTALLRAVRATWQSPPAGG